MKQKNKQLRLFLVLTAMTAAAGCGLLTKGSKTPKTVKVSGTIEIEEPVCGQQAGTGNTTGRALLTNTTYYIKHGTTNHPDSIAFDEFETDENGHFSIRLAPGNYAVVHVDKLMNYGEFRLKHSSVSNYFKVRDEDCFRRWYNSPDFLLQISSDTTLQLLVKSRCYTKTNPCIEYTGPR